MTSISRQIGWSNESNLLYQILKQLTRLTSVVFGLKPKYKVYTALLTQSGGSSVVGIYNGGDYPIVIGATYLIIDNGGSGWDFTNIGAPNNDLGTYFVATGLIPNSWGIDGQLESNLGAPVATVLENTIGNIWFTYDGVGYYSIKSYNLFTDQKTTFFFGPLDNNIGNPIVSTDHFGNNTSNYSFFTTDTIAGQNGLLYNTPIEIRVYN